MAKACPATASKPATGMPSLREEAVTEKQEKKPPGQFKLPAYRGLPNGWIKLAQRPDGIFYEYRTGLRALVSVAREKDGRDWVHLSLSRPNRMPTYEDMCLVKDLFIGENELAIQVFVPKDRHVNLHPNCLHLWHCLDGDPVPDFSRLVKGVRMI